MANPQEDKFVQVMAHSAKIHSKLDACFQSWCSQILVVTTNPCANRKEVDLVHLHSDQSIELVISL